MSLPLRMAWRNLFRNKRRTYLTASILGMGLAALILTDAVIQGMESNMVRIATGTFLGQAQVHARGFRLENDVDNTVRDLPKVVGILKDDPSVAAFTERTQAMAMVTSANDAESVMLYGIDPKTEAPISRIAASVTLGGPLVDAGDPGILLGARLAETLGVGVGDRVVVTAARSGGGDLAQEMFRVRGVFTFASAEMDRHLAFIGLARSRSLLGLGDRAHEVALRFKQGNGSEAVHRALLDGLSQGGNEALDWSRLMPDLKSAIEMTGFSSAFLAVLLAALVALAILNTLFMAIYERMFEFGVLRALGTRATRLGGMVVLEAACLGFLSVLLGTVFSLVVIAVLSRVGINYTGIEMAGVTFQDAIYPQMRVLQFTVFPLGVWLFTLVIACYPAWTVTRILPAKAMHRSLG